MDQLPDYYRILHVHRDAPVEVIRASYRTIMQRLKQHPDLGGDHRRAALINEAYRTLTSAEKRAAYDRQLATNPGNTALAADGARDNDDRFSITSPGLVDRCLFCGSTHSEMNNPMAVCSQCDSPLGPAAHPKLESQGQRAVARIARNHPIVFYRSWPGQAESARTRDISVNGISFVAPGPVDKGVHLKIQGDLLSAVARVTHCQEEAGDRGSVWIVGAVFITLKFARTQGSFVSARI